MMRKLATWIVVLALGLCMSTVAAQAQIGLLGKGIKAGVNFANLHGSDVRSGLDSRTGIAGGLYLRYGIGTALYIQPEVLYSMKGSKTTVADTTTTLKLDYIEVPIMLKYAFQGSGSSITPNIGVGPAFAFKVSAKDSEDPGQTADVSSDFKGFDLGLAFAGGLDFAAGPSAVSLDVRYTMGLSKIGNSTPTPSVKNGAWTVSVGYGF